MELRQVGTSNIYDATDSSYLRLTDNGPDSVNRNTFAYPTTLTNADNFSSYVQYHFDFGATTRTQSPAPANQSQGAIQTMTYNSLGQLERITTTSVCHASLRFYYRLEPRNGSPIRRCLKTLGRYFDNG